MLQLVIPDLSFYDEDRCEFVYRKGATIQMEHSLVSVSKWEAKWHVPFLSTEEKTEEQMLDYYRCMTLTQNVDPEVYHNIVGATAKKVLAYIEDPMTATWFKDSGKGGRQIVTNELIYFWMTTFGIPFECQKWHLNHLMTLIHVCSEKNAPPKKMGRHDAMAQNRALNAARRKQMHTRG